MAYVGVTTPESITKSNPTNFQNGTGGYIYSLCEDADGQSLYRQVQDAVDAARSEGAVDRLHLADLAGGRAGLSDTEDNALSKLYAVSSYCLD